MPAQIIFISLFLGLVSGLQQVALQVSGPVKSVRLFAGGKEKAVLTSPPWHATVDFGPELTPRDLTAVGYDARGEEIARATQVLNLPRRTAEFEIAIEKHDVWLRWRHLMNEKPEKATVTLDGKPLAVDEKLHARLPKLDPDAFHVITAEIRFADGEHARRDLVIESTRSDSVRTELTPVVVRETSKAHPKAWDECLSTASGKALRTAAVETPRALVILVRDPDPREYEQELGTSIRLGGAMTSYEFKKMFQLDRDTVQRILWPVAKRFSAADDVTSVLFEPSVDLDAKRAGMLYLMLVGYVGRTDNLPKQYADAVAVAGVRAVTGGQRRAVVLALSENTDTSKHQPAVVRRYLESLGVPLFVWSVKGPRPDLLMTWGPVDDISTFGKLDAAVQKLRRTLAEQRIAWVDVDPLTALQVKANEKCGIATGTHAAP